MFYVYVIKSINSSFKYVGMTQNPENRLIKHNSGAVKSTKAYKPYIMIYTEKVGSGVEARKREKYLKSAAGR